MEEIKNIKIEINTEQTKYMTRYQTQDMHFNIDMVCTGEKLELVMIPNCKKSYPGGK